VQYNNGTNIITHANASKIPQGPLQVRVLSSSVYWGPGTGWSGAIRSIDPLGQAGTALKAKSYHDYAIDGRAPVNIQVDWLFVRKCQDPEPTVTIGWSYEKIIDISPATLVADYQIKLLLTGGIFNYSEAKPDGSDIRFYDNYSNSLHYWIESWNTTGISIIWVKIPTAGTSQIYMYYGNPTAVSKSNGEATFLFFDDFPGTSINTSKWTTDSASYSSINVAGGVVSISTDTPDTSQIDVWGSLVLGFCDYWVRQGQTFPWEGNNGTTFGMISSGHQVVTRNSVGGAIETFNTVPQRTWFTPEIRWINDSIVQYNNGTNIITHANASKIPQGPLQVRVLSSSVYWGPGTGWSGAIRSIDPLGQAGTALKAKSYHDYAIDGRAPVNIQVDWLFVRKCQDPEPVAILFSPNSPNISGPNDFSFNYGDSGYSILWSVSDPSPANYTVYQNGTIFNEGTWTTSVLVSLEGIEEGIHNFTCVVRNIYELKASDEVWIVVQPATPDMTPPIISSPANITFEEGSIGYSIIWIGSDDLAPWWASVWRNTTLIYSQAWIGNDVVIPLDGLSVGAYFFNCTLSDERGNSASNIVEVTVYPAVPDTQAPTIIPPTPVSFEEGTADSVITFECADNHPYIYRVTVNDTETLYNPWRGENISISVEDLQIGRWIIKLELWDLAGNQASAEVVVTIIPPLPDTTPPAISQPVDMFVLENMGGTITWEVNDDHPQFLILQRNGTLIYSQDHWTSGLIQYSFSSLTLGMWSYTLTVWDQSGNSASSSAIVNVVPGSAYDNLPPAINHLPDTEVTFGTFGNSLTFYLFDPHPQGYRVNLDSAVISEHAWSTSNIQVMVYLDGLAVGIYQVNVTAWDTYSNQATRTVKVTVVGDVNPPTISSPPDTIAPKGTSTKIIWEVSDSTPSRFEVKILSNGSIISEGIWSGENIEFSLDHLEVGVNYHFRCTVYDQSGNFAQDDVQVTITKASSSPGFEFPGILSLLFFSIFLKKKKELRGVRNE
jgi:hypothetical protein